MQIEVSTTRRLQATPGQPALFDMDAQQQNILDFSEHARPSLEVRDQSIIAAQLSGLFAHHISGCQPQLWSSVVTAGWKDSPLELLHSFDPKIQDIDLMSDRAPGCIVQESAEGLGQTSAPWACSCKRMW